MNWKTEWKKLLIIIITFIVCFYLPIGTQRFDNAILESFHLIKWYTKEHVVFCLVPAFFIAGAIGVFINQSVVIRYLGSKTNKIIAYSIASMTGTVLTVCSCTILPIFSGIYKKGAGLGPAITFLYSGPAINVLAIILTIKVFGIQLGIARALGAIFFSIIIGIIMQVLFPKKENNAVEPINNEAIKENSALWKNSGFFISLVGILVFANWIKPDGSTSGLWLAIYNYKWIITLISALLLNSILVGCFHLSWWKMAISFALIIVMAKLYPNQPIVPFVAGVLGLSVCISSSKNKLSDWFAETWSFAKQMLPLLLLGVFMAGILLGRVGHEGLIPAVWVTKVVGGNSLQANFFASFFGAFMYFATLTEIPIISALMNNGMGKGPALALFLAGPALSLPNMLVIRGVIGTQKTIVFTSLVIIMATISGAIYGSFFG